MALRARVPYKSGDLLNSLFVAHICGDFLSKSEVEYFAKVQFNVAFLSSVSHAHTYDARK